MAEWFSCNGACSGSDPTSDTVKVDVALLAAAGKENVQPKQAPEKAHEAQKAWEEQKKKEKELKAAEERRQLEEEAQRRREEEDANQRREEEAASERAAADHKRMEREGREAALKEREAVSRKEREALDAQRAAEVQNLCVCEAAEKEEKRQAGEKVAAWCKKNSFVNMTTQKSGFMSCMSGSKFPLHTAVTNKDVEVVRLMVLLEVDKGAKNSKGQTAADLATALNKDRSMDAILACLK